MNRISKEKRSQLILVALIVVGIIAGLWFSVIRSQKEDLHTLAAKKTEDLNQLTQIAETIKNSEMAKKELVTVSNDLVFAEREMPTGDLYLSLVNTIRKFNHDHNVQISQFNPTGGDTPVNLLPKFPYRQVTVSISGMAHFHDIGKFVADFENTFPTSRILNLDLSPAPAAVPEDKEKLAFKMDIVSLVANNGARSANNP